MSTYKQAGVDIEKGDELVERIKPLAQSTITPGVIGALGGFGALFDINATKQYKHPILVSGTDGVGTKLVLAFKSNKHNTIGIDLVAMCVNDVITCGAKPLFFLDYFATGKLDVDIGQQVISGIAQGCSLAGCALVGGETAEMPSMYGPGEYDLAGFAVGIVEKDDIIDGSDVAVNDVVIGLESSGFHSNGYSLVRHSVYNTLPLAPETLDGQPLFDKLLTPTMIYARLVQHLILVANTTSKIKAMAHITGGGIVGNVPRMFSDDFAAVIKTDSWKRPVEFDWIQQREQLDDGEMLQTFNCGIGYVLVVEQKIAATIIDSAKSAGVKAWQIGYISKREQGQSGVVLL